LIIFSCVQNASYRGSRPDGLHIHWDCSRGAAWYSSGSGWREESYEQRQDDAWLHAGASPNSLSEPPCCFGTMCSAWRVIRGCPLGYPATFTRIPSRWRTMSRIRWSNISGLAHKVLVLGILRDRSLVCLSAQLFNVRLKFRIRAKVQKSQRRTRASTRQLMGPAIGPDNSPQSSFCISRAAISSLSPGVLEIRSASDPFGRFVGPGEFASVPAHQVDQILGKRRYQNVVRAAADIVAELRVIIKHFILNSPLMGCPPRRSYEK
jgi:hypothetical protein